MLKDKVNLKKIMYIEKSSTPKEKKVTFVPSTKDLHFNEVMVATLDISKWKQVLVGHDPDTKIIALKLCSGDEFGSVPIRHIKTKYKHNNRHIYIGHLSWFKSNIELKAERIGEIILLEEIKNDNKKS